MEIETFLIVPFAFLSSFYEPPSVHVQAADFALFIESAAYKYFCACAVISNPFNQYDGVFTTGKTNRQSVMYDLYPVITMRPTKPAYSYRHGLNFVLGIVKTRIDCYSGITYPSPIVMARLFKESNAKLRAPAYSRALRRIK